MAQKAEYQAIQVSTAAQLTGELNKLAQNGWKPILMSSTAPLTAGGVGMVTVTVIVEHVLGT